jgi:DNA-3-methyladenine glycosylase
LEPIEGVEIMARNRSTWKNDAGSAGRPPRLTTLCSGPARLCQSFGIERKQNGTDLCGDEIWIGRKKGREIPARIARSTRIGIRNGVVHEWRFYLTGNPFVSHGKPSQERNKSSK